jgi:hypothetical protein
MEKHKKTARELSDMILMKLAVAGIRVDVHRDTVGWHVVVYGSTPERVRKMNVAAGRCDGQGDGDPRGG